MVGGNVAAEVWRTVRVKDERGVGVEQAEKVMDLRGWLDYQSGQKGHTAYQAPVEDSTHLFLCDYRADYAELSEKGLSLKVFGKSYEVRLIDDPMGLHEHIETYLRYVGAE